MPLLEGVSPIRRTLPYLQAGKLVFKDRVKVMTLNYRVDERAEVIRKHRLAHPVNVNDPNVFQQRPWYIQSHPAHHGIQAFDHWNVPQIQYKNPHIQIASFKNQAPAPFIACYMDDGEEVLFDVDNHTSTQILDRLIKVLGKSEETLALEALAAEKKDNPANFGKNCSRFCICNVPGQVPCPSLVPLPKHWRGKYHHGFEDEDD